MKYVSKGNFEIVEYDDLHLIVPKENSDSGFVVNESSEFILNCLETPQVLDTLIERLMERYNVNAKKAKEDIEKFLAILQENFLLDVIE